MTKNSNIPKIKFSDFLINQKEPKITSPSYVKFWLKHIEYCKSGVIVGGVYFSPWLYWHINFFKIPMDAEDEYGSMTRVVGTPPLRDNEWYINWGIEQSVKQQRPITIFGSRRIAKSVTEASKICHEAWIKKNSESLSFGADSKDLKNIADYIDYFYANRPSCFSDLRKFGNFTSLVEIAVNKKESTKKDPVTGEKGQINPITKHLLDLGKENKVLFSKIAIRNLEHGQKVSKEELLAGLTPSCVIADEVGKYSYKLALAALKPAIVASNGKYRTLPILAGTGGNTTLSADAKDNFLDAEKTGFTVINVEEYKKIVKPKYFQYTQKSDKKVGLFPPGAMSFGGGEKIGIPIYEYLNREFTEEEKKDLEGCIIQVTDWENANERVKAQIEIDKYSSDEEGKKAQMYYPFQPEDCFLSRGINIFPADDAKRTRDKLEGEDNWGEFVELDMEKTGVITVHESKEQPVKAYPFAGGGVETPICIYERPIFEDPREIKYGTYVAGFDGVKIDTSNTTDSLNALYIFKRQAGVSGFQNQIVASYIGRPNIDTKFYRQAMLLLKLYRAECLPESDVNFTKYLKGQKAEYLLAQAQGTNMRINASSNANSTNGLPATANNKRHLLKLVKDYCWQEFPTENYDDVGNPIMELGVQRIPDPMLLKEIEEFGTQDNYDRIMAFGHALIWDEELSINNIRGSERAIGVDIVKQYDKLISGTLGRNKKYL